MRARLWEYNSCRGAQSIHTEPEELQEDFLRRQHGEN